MPSWVGVAGTFVPSLIVAYWFLRLRCRRLAPPFGPQVLRLGAPFGRRARYWVFFIVVATAIASTGVGLLMVAVSGHVHAVYIGIIVSSGLWFAKIPPQRDRDMLPRTLSSLPTLPFSRLYDRMGDDRQAWLDTRTKAAAVKPQWISDAVEYYHYQVVGRLRDAQARADLERWRSSITHKIDIWRLIDLDANPARLRDSLQMHSSTRNLRRYNDDDLERLARRLETEALNELEQFLAYLYRLGYHKLLIYPFRPGTRRPDPRPAEPIDL
jgi:hypothetical protein